MADPPEFGLLYDLCNPPFAKRSFEDFWAQVLEQLQWAERLGMDAVWVPEHHFIKEGYPPSPLPILAAMAAITTRMRLGTSLVVPAFHNPIRLAEDVATLSILSNGRFDLGLGLGYLKRDFEAYGQRLENRVGLLKETVEVLRRAMAKESLRFDAKQFELPDVTIAPIPQRAPRILIGAHKTKAIERAARIADGFISGMSLDDERESSDYETYLRALEEVGKDPAEAYVCAVQWMLVAEDPEAAWANGLGNLALYQLNLYAGWGALPGISGFESRDELIRDGWITLMDGPTAAENFTQFLRAHPCVREIQSQAIFPGEPVESRPARLEYYVNEVVEPVRRRLATIEE